MTRSRDTRSRRNMPCMGRHPRSELVEDSPTQDTETAGHQIPGPCALPLTSPSRDWPLCWMIQAQAAVIFCSDLFLPSLLLPLPSSVPSGATLSPQSNQSFSRAVVRQRAGWAVTASWGCRETGATKVSLLRTSSCPTSPWCDQTCTGSDPDPESSAVSLWPSCCPRTCHLEWLLGSGYGSCRHRAEGRHAREP